jgi:hypothetical protein
LQSHPLSNSSTPPIPQLSTLPLQRYKYSTTEYSHEHSSQIHEGILLSSMLTFLKRCTQTVYNPHRRTSTFKTPRLVSQLNGITRSVATNIIESVCVNSFTGKNLIRFEKLDYPRVSYRP